MRSLTTAALTAIAVFTGAVFTGRAQADWVPPVKGNDIGAIISYHLVGGYDIRQLAVDHCAKYGKIVRLTGVQPVYGGYVSFACIWAPSGGLEHPISVKD